jgi:hypothetical protein
VDDQFSGGEERIGRGVKELFFCFVFCSEEKSKKQEQKQEENRRVEARERLKICPMSQKSYLPNCVKICKKYTETKGQQSVCGCPTKNATSPSSL